MRIVSLLILHGVSTHSSRCTISLGRNSSESEYTVPDISLAPNFLYMARLRPLISPQTRLLLPLLRTFNRHRSRIIQRWTTECPFLTYLHQRHLTNQECRMMSKHLLHLQRHPITHSLVPGTLGCHRPNHRRLLEVRYLPAQQKPSCLGLLQRLLIDEVTVSARDQMCWAVDGAECLERRVSWMNMVRSPTLRLMNLHAPLVPS